MSQRNRLNPDTEAYLRNYRRILERMIEGMTQARLGDSISANFIVQMIPHHRAAIEMSENLLANSCFTPLVQIAQNIICTQEQSIAQMERILRGCSRKTNCSDAVCRYQDQMDCILQTMFDEMKNARAGNNINMDFMREMIPHHEGAVRMAQTTLKYDICEALVPILQAIIKEQEEGIRKMERLLRECER
ncbi:MAG: DUF305 domain-containing protein [Clostridium sp.]|nr:DUF305 domain-containing protein [Clostridium sp.]